MIRYILIISNEYSYTQVNKTVLLIHLHMLWMRPNIFICASQPFEYVQPDSVTYGELYG